MSRLAGENGSNPRQTSFCATCPATASAPKLNVLGIPGMSFAKTTSEGWTGTSTLTNLIVGATATDSAAALESQGPAFRSAENVTAEAGTVTGLLLNSVRLARLFAASCARVSASAIPAGDPFNAEPPARAQASARF